MPRPYTLAKRAEQQAATRARIVAATLAIYRDGGFAAATTLAIARAADVAPATVRNHFPTPAGLAAAAADAVLAETHLPGPEIFGDRPTVAARVDRLARELAAFFERSASWWQVRQGDPDLAAAWGGLEARYYEHVAQLAAEAISPVGEDPTTVAALVTIVGGPLYFALRGAGRTPEEAVAVELSVILPWIGARFP